MQTLDRKLKGFACHYMVAGVSVVACIILFTLVENGAASIGFGSACRMTMKIFSETSSMTGDSQPYLKIEHHVAIKVLDNVKGAVVSDTGFVTEESVCRDSYPKGKEITNVVLTTYAQNSYGPDPEDFQRMEDELRRKDQAAFRFIKSGSVVEATLYTTSDINNTWYELRDIEPSSPYMVAFALFSPWVKMLGVSLVIAVLLIIVWRLLRHPPPRHGGYSS